MKRGKRYQECAKLVDSSKVYEAKEAFEIIEKMPKYPPLVLTNVSILPIYFFNLLLRHPLILQFLLP